MADLPPEIITEILVRFPVKSLLRFRCISKPLCSQIDDPGFTKLHLHRSTQSRSDRVLILSHPPGCKFYSLDLDSLDQPCEIDTHIPFMTPGWDIIDHPLLVHDRDTMVVVEGSCNGLLFLYKHHDRFCLWNPSTRRSLKVPVLRPYDVHVFAYGFGYDSLRDDYKVLMIGHRHGDSATRAYVYSMKLNRWRQISGYPFLVYGFRFAGIYFRGALHFVVHRAPTLYSTSMCNSWVVSVDLADEEEEYRHREVLLPPGFLKKYSWTLAVLNECLCLSCFERDGIFELWMMKDYGVVESWFKMLSFSMWQEYTTPPNRALTTSECGNEVILHAYENEFHKYDLKNKTLEKLNVGGLPIAFMANDYQETLVNPASSVSPHHGIV